MKQTRIAYSRGRGQVRFILAPSSCLLAFITLPLRKGLLAAAPSEWKPEAEVGQKERDRG